MQVTIKSSMHSSFSIKIKSNETLIKIKIKELEILN